MVVATRPVPIPCPIRDGALCADPECSLMICRERIREKEVEDARKAKQGEINRQLEQKRYEQTPEGQAQKRQMRVARRYHRLLREGIKPIDL
jgi:hypothetical protein